MREGQQRPLVSGPRLRDLAVLFLLQQYFHRRSSDVSVSSDMVKFKAGMSGLMPLLGGALATAPPAARNQAPASTLQGAWAGLEEEGRWGAQGVCTG